jgi:hypothetical protein
MLEHYKNKSNAQFIHPYLEWSSKDENTSIDITMTISEEYKFLQWIKEMVFWDIKFTKEM